MRSDQVCVLLMTYGSPTTLEDIPSYLKNIRGGREPDQALIEEFRRRYSLIGGSPLVKITRAQAAALEVELNRSANGRAFRAAAAMRFSPPYIDDVVREVAPESGTVVGIVMSPQFSPTIMGGYVESLRSAVERLRRDKLALAIAKDWHLQPLLVGAFAERLKQALARYPPEVRDNVPVLMTAHSMPKTVVEGEPGYVAQLKETAAAIAGSLGLGKDRWMFCYQSAGHTPEEWLRPDFADMIPRLREAGHRDVLIAPVQFLADHLEVLYDIEIGAREQAEPAGVRFSRTQSLNTSPLLIKALSAVARGVLVEAK